MSQFDLFGGQESSPTDVPAPARPAVPQPPAIIKEGTPLPHNEMGLKPLLVINADWLEILITDAQFATARAQYSDETSDDFVMLQLLQERGARMNKPCTDTRINYLYEYVAAPFVIRKRTVPGFAITCRQGPATT